MVEEKGKNLALASMILGIVGLVFTFLINTLLGLILGIVGLVLASKSKQLGFTGGMRTAGFVTSLISVILGAVLFVLAAVACVAAIGIMSMA
ncbi:hypothetical protein [Flavonifractor sp. HCP28S3_F3]|uniref:hypothetical protein n=1 Tax=Flavonifractor sp. HCP28S3_F3 TaxID=3438939 RepID=UPI003F88E823